MQCGCYTSAMDVDRDGQWDLFAGSGDDRTVPRDSLFVMIHLSLKTIWKYDTDDNAIECRPRAGGHRRGWPGGDC